MGIPVSVEAPPFVKHPFRVATDVPSAWIEREHAFDAAPRLLLSLFLPDQPGLFRATLNAVDDGVIAPMRGGTEKISLESRSVRFSVDGSLASVLRGAFTTAMVVRPLISDELASVAPDIKDLLPELLRGAVAKRLDDLGLPEHWYKNIEAHVFEGKADSLFADRRFSEYRFGVAKGAVDGMQRLAQMTLEFAQLLGKHQVPIAYLHFPDAKTGETKELDWVRLGIGAPTRAVDSMELDLGANAVAMKYRSIFKKYDAAKRENRSEPFALIANYEDVEARAQVEGRAKDDNDELVDVVFAQGPARAGLVGDMLADPTTGPRLLAGSMTVIAGHTISSWVLPAGLGSQLVGHIRKLGPVEGTSELSRVHVPDALKVESGVNVEGQSIWIAWGCRDKPGVVRRIVDRVVELVEEITGQAPSVVYEISRVLARDQGCAGKIKLLVPPSLCEAKESWSETIRLTLSETLPLDDVSGEPADIRVGFEEPNEEPWASLLLA